jgi:hypothetical protein
MVRYTLPMKTGLMTILLLALPLQLHAHPGKTDRYGGHQCIKECEEWDLYYREYHLHDKEGRAVRVAQKRQRTKRVIVSDPEASLPVRDIAVPLSAPPPLHAAVLPDPDPELFPRYWLLLLLLLLVLLLLWRTRSRTRDSDS